MHTLNEKECPQAGVIRFKRHVKAKYDAKAKKWVILAEDRWEWESTVVLVVQAEEILDLIHSKANGLAEWASDARMTMRLKQTDQVVVMIKGLQKYYAKTKTLANREFTAAARASLGEINPVRRPVGVRADKAMVERELVKLQVAERCFLVHGTSSTQCVGASQADQQSKRPKRSKIGSITSGPTSLSDL